jgi:hypothetical protein
VIGGDHDQPHGDLEREQSGPYVEGRAADQEGDRKDRGDADDEAGAVGASGARAREEHAACEARYVDEAAASLSGEHEAEEQWGGRCGQ